MMLIISLLLLLAARNCESTLPNVQEICAEVPVDVAFILDSSGSVGSYYQNELDFVKDIATAFLRKSDNNRAGVVSFSGSSRLDIGMGAYIPGQTGDHVTSFRNAVDNISHMQSVTRIDLGLLEVRNKLFTYSESGRYNVQKLIVLLTDGRSTSGDPVTIAQGMRRSGIMIIVIGIGNNLDLGMLRSIGGDDNFYRATDFTDLVSNEFVNGITDSSCKTIYLPAEDGKFYKLYNKTETFATSKTFCENEGSRVLIADSQDTMKVIKDNFAALSIWLGAQYDSSRGAWFWTDGQPLGLDGLFGTQGPRGSNICLSSRDGKLYHSPCSAGHVFVCQKGVTKPDPPVVSYAVSNLDPFSGFRCEFQRKNFGTPSTYEVAWFTSRPNSPGEQLVSQTTLQSGNTSDLGPGSDHIGKNVFCKVRVWHTSDPGVKSGYAISNLVYTGIELQPSAITVFEGGPPVEVKIRPTFPIKCTSGSQKCDMNIFVNSTVTETFSDIMISPCHIVFMANETREWKTMTFRTNDDMVETGATTRNLRLSLERDHDTESVWAKHQPIDLQVRRENVNSGSCTSTGDPHIRTFDGVFYDHYYVGDYVLVKGLARDFEIHARTQRCSGVSCNCGVAVKEGEDVLSINLCGQYTSPDVRYLSNREPQQGTRIEQSPNGKTFIIKLASTASVKFAARRWSNTFYADITVQLPTGDFKQTAGLCGNFDNVPGNDFMDRNGTIRSGCGKQGCQTFTESWKVLKNESLFCYNGGNMTCQESNETKTVEDKAECSNYWSTSSSTMKVNDQMTQGYKKVVFAGQHKCDAKRNSSIPNDVIVAPKGVSGIECGHHGDQSVGPISFTFPTPYGITENNATAVCRGGIESSKVYIVCKEEMGNTFPVDGFVHQCVEDVKILDDRSAGLQSAIEAMKRVCEDIVLRNQSADHERLLDSMCPYECSFRGRCENRSCICESGFKTEDCSEYEIPEIEFGPLGIQCDVRTSSCDKVTVRGSKLARGAMIVCGVSSNNGLSFSSNPVEIISNTEVRCQLQEPNPTRDRYLAPTIPIATYVIYLSNDNGTTYSTSGAPVTVYDSKCMVCSNATANGRQVKDQCHLKNNTCLIDGYCYNNGEADPLNPECGVCDPSKSTSKFVVDLTDSCAKAVVSFSCDKSSVTASVDSKKLEDLIVENISIENCPHGDYNVTNNTVTTSYERCAHNITQSKDVIMQETHLGVKVCETDSSNTICRISLLTFELKCYFTRRLNTTTGDGYTMSEKKLVFTKKADTNLTAQMLIYTNDLYTTEAGSPLQVTSFEPIYIAVKATKENTLYKFIVEECFATPSADPADSVNYMFFYNKCATDSTFKVYTEHSSDNKFSYKIDAFRFIAIETRVFFHCRLLICKKTSISKECTQKCGVSGRTRRALGEGGVEEAYINSGPIVYKSKPTCMTMSCPSNSHCHDLHPAVCRCNEDYIMDLTSNTCKKTSEYVIKVTNVRLNNQFLPSYSTATNKEFIRLASFIEKQLMTAYSVDHDIIHGVKVLKARKGSIVLDISLLHSDSVTSGEAFDHFLEAVINLKGIATGPLDIMSDSTPMLETYRLHKAGKSMATKLIIVTAVVSVVVVSFLIAVVVGICIQRHGGKRKNKEMTIHSFKDNMGMSTDTLS